MQLNGMSYMKSLYHEVSKVKMNFLDQSTLELVYTYLSRPPNAHMVLRNTPFYVVVNNV